MGSNEMEPFSAIQDTRFEGVFRSNTMSKSV